MQGHVGIRTNFLYKLFMGTSQAISGPNVNAWVLYQSLLGDWYVNQLGLGTLILGPTSVM
jgi:hypothetical protein